MTTENETEYGILILGLASAGFLDEPEWLVSFDPNDHAPGKPYPTGFCYSDIDPAKAKRFKNKVDAWQFWNIQSDKVPFRPDGKPNKPLTAFTVEIKALP